MKLYDSFVNINNTSKSHLDKNSIKNSARVHHKKKKLDSESFLNISRRNNKDDTLLSNSIILTVISNFLDTKSDNKKAKKKSKDNLNSQRKNSTDKKGIQKINKSTKTLLNDYHNINNISINNMNNSITKNSNCPSIEYNSKKDLLKKKVYKKRSLEERSAKEILELKINKDNNIMNVSKKEIGKLKAPRRAGTIGITNIKNNKFKETVINREKTIEEFPIKKKKTIKPRKLSNLLKLNNKRNSLFLSNFNHLHISSKKNNIMTIEKEQNENNPNELMAILAFRELHKKLKNNIGNNIKDKLYNYENNDITDAINKLPSIEPNNNKSFIGTEKTIVQTEGDKELNENKNISKQYEEDKEKSNNILDNDDNKEKNRIFTLKGNVYDSLDDDEIIEEIVDNPFFTPDSDFLLIFDTIVMISSFIILLYFPFYLAKNISFNDSIFNFNNILFYFIDFIYILDFVLEFFIAFYNFDEILVRDSYEIFKHYLNGWLLFDLITSVPVFSLITIFENKNIVNKYMFSHYYNTNINQLQYLFSFFKVIKTFKVFSSNNSLTKLGKILNENEFINDWGNAFLFLFYLFPQLISVLVFLFLWEGILIKVG